MYSSTPNYLKVSVFLLKILFRRTLLRAFIKQVKFSKVFDYFW